jgi:RimJ/RimL family protein N-acetyltransferase
VTDAEALCAFMNEIADEGLDTISGLRPSLEEERDFLSKVSQKERAIILVATDGKRIIGMLDAWAGDKAHNRNAARLGMSVLAPYRRAGIGRRMLQMAIADMQRWPDFCRIELDVAPWNEPAIRLYESEGFMREGTRRKAATFHGRPTDLLLMALVW